MPRSSAPRHTSEAESLSVIGLGKLGLCLAVTLAKAGYPVVGVESDERRARAIAAGSLQTKERGLVEELAKYKRRLVVQSNIPDAIATTSTSFIVVPTPSDGDGGFSLDFVLPVVDQIGRALRTVNRYHLVVVTSTVMPGATDSEIRPLLERLSGKTCGKEFGLCYSPEFIALGDVLDGLSHPDFVLIGESDSGSGAALAKIQRSVVGPKVPIVRMPPVSAEITKLAVNAFITLKISFANTVAEISEKYPGADVDTITGAIGTDARIGRAYLRGSLGFGGPCFPRDTVAFSRAAKFAGSQSYLTDAAHDVNQTQIQRALALIEGRGIRPPQTVSLLGLTYKPGTDVTEASQSLLLANALVGRGFEVNAYDPAFTTGPIRELDARVRVVGSVKQSLEGATVCIVATAWEEFKQLRAADFDDVWVFDCWRIFRGTDVADCPKYFSIGVGRAGTGHGRAPSSSSPKSVGLARLRPTSEATDSSI